MKPAVQIDIDHNHAYVEIVCHTAGQQYDVAIAARTLGYKVRLNDVPYYPDKANVPAFEDYENQDTLICYLKKVIPEI